MRKGGVDIAVHRILKRCLYIFKIGAQVVTLSRDIEQLIVHIDGRAVDDLIAGGAQDGVCNLALGHRLTTDSQRIGRVNIPVRIRRIGAGGLQHTLGRIDTGLHILAGVFKHLLALHGTDMLAVHLNIQHKMQAQTAAHNDHKRRRCHSGQYVGNSVPQKDRILTDTAGQIACLGCAYLPGTAVLQLRRQLMDMADARCDANKGAGQIFDQGDQADQDRAQYDQKQIQHSIRDAAHHSADLTADTHTDILDPEADHVQHVADRIPAVEIFHIFGGFAAVFTALFLLIGMRKTLGRLIRRLDAVFFFSLRGIQNTEAPFRVKRFCSPHSQGSCVRVQPCSRFSASASAVISAGSALSTRTIFAVSGCAKQMIPQCSAWRAIILSEPP